jgi:hypothetical protein
LCASVGIIKSAFIYLLIYGFCNAAAKNSNYTKTNIKDEQPIMICKGYEEGGSVIILT